MEQRAPALPAAERSVGGAAATKFGDGCYHVFLDLGSNRGVHGRFVFEPEKYPDNGLNDFFDTAFSSKDRQHMPLCVFAFEPNPHHAAAQRATEEAYRRMGWSYTFFNVGVGAVNSTMNFFQNDGNIASRSYWGFASFDFTGIVKHNRTARILSLPVLDLTAWIQLHILPRSIPVWHQNRSDPVPPRLVIKMDIEGLEIPVLTKMLVSGVLCKVDSMVLEVHANNKFTPMAAGPGVDLPTPKDVRSYFNSLQRILKAANCTRLLEKDSEAYLLDGVPYPSPK